MIQRNFRQARGGSVSDCHVLATRWSDLHAWSRDGMESWVLQLLDGRIHLLKGQLGWLTDLWRSPSGRVFVTESAPPKSSGVWVNFSSNPTQANWRKYDIPCDLTGCWGLSDEFVIAWGGVDEQAKMFQWDGQAWKEMPSPRGMVMGMHGLSPRLMFAVGPGLISRWDGVEWNQMTIPTKGYISSVYVVSENEVYASGAVQRVYQGSIHGWVERAWAPGTLFDVVKWRDDVLIAGRGLGLLKLVDDKLETIDDKVHAIKLSPGERLIVLTEDAVMDTEDFKSFRSVSIDLFKDAVRSIKPLFAR